MFFQTGRRQSTMEQWLSDSEGTITVEPLKAVSTKVGKKCWKLAMRGKSMKDNRRSFDSAGAQSRTCCAQDDEPLFSDCLIS